MQPVRLLLLFIILFIMGTQLHGAEIVKKQNDQILLPKDVFFQIGGGSRLRYSSTNVATFGSFGGAGNIEDDSNVSHRAQLDFLLHKGEYFQTFFRLIHVDTWGRASNANGDTNPGLRDSFSANNGLFVNQAYALWKVADSLGLQFGRSPIVLGRGLSYGENDWFNLPYSFDHFDILWDWNSIELSLIAAKIQELEPIGGQTISPDPEENHYIIDLEFTNLADSIKTFDIHFAQINRENGSADGGANAVSALNVQRFGIDLDIETSRFYGSFFAAFVTGSEERITGSTQNRSVSQLAVDLDVGVKFPAINELRFWAGYHVDSGDPEANDPNRNSNKSYDGFYYDVYGRAGRMDFLRWGNLSYYRIGLSANLFTGFELGGEYFDFERTEAADNVNFGTAGAFLKTQIDANAFTLDSSKKLGEEFDIWVKWDFPSGVKFKSTLTAFFPGEVFSNVAPPSTEVKATDTAFQFLTQVGIFF